MFFNLQQNIDFCTFLDLYLFDSLSGAILKQSGDILKQKVKNMRLNS